MNNPATRLTTAGENRMNNVIPKTTLESRVKFVTILDIPLKIVDRKLIKSNRETHYSTVIEKNKAMSSKIVRLLLVIIEGKKVIKETSTAFQHQT